MTDHEKAKDDFLKLCGQVENNYLITKEDEIRAKAFHEGYRDGTLDAQRAHEDDMKRLKAENRRLTGELEQVYERLNDLTEKIKNIAEKHNIKATNVENLQEKDIN